MPPSHSWLCTKRNRRTASHEMYKLQAQAVGLGMEFLHLWWRASPLLAKCSVWF